MELNGVNQKIIDAILEKARRECPEVLDAVAVYGSVCSGDVHAHSDLDLLILINDPRGYALADAFILEDESIGYDLYCTSWEMLENDANCGHAHLGKLMDCEVIYVRDESVTERLEGLKNQVREILGSDKRFELAAGIRDELCKNYGYAMTTESIGELRTYAAYLIELCLDAVMLWNGVYFKRGVKRTFEELEGLDLPDDFEKNIMRIVQAKNYVELGIYLASLFKTVMRFTQRKTNKKEPTKEALAGTYEEMFSNWRNKMPEATERVDAFASFMNLASLQFMFEGIAAENAIPKVQVMEKFDANNLAKNAKIFDDALGDYRQEYNKLGMEVKQFHTVDDFVRVYLKEA